MNRLSSTDAQALRNQGIQDIEVQNDMLPIYETRSKTGGTGYPETFVTGVKVTLTIHRGEGKIERHQLQIHFPKPIPQGKYQVNKHHEEIKASVVKRTAEMILKGDHVSPARVNARLFENRLTAQVSKDLKPSFQKTVAKARGTIERGFFNVIGKAVDAKETIQKNLPNLELKGKKAATATIMLSPREKIPTKETTMTTQGISQSGALLYQEQLMKLNPINRRLGNADTPIQELAKGMCGVLKLFGAKSGRGESFTAAKGPATGEIKFKIPTLDFQNIDPAKTYTLCRDDQKRQVAYSGEEILRWKESAFIRRCPDTNVQGGEGRDIRELAAKGLTDSDAKKALMSSYTYSDVPPPVARDDGTLIPRQSGDRGPSHGICNLSAPDLTDPEIKALFSQNGKLDMDKVEGFLRPLLKDVLQQKEIHGKQVLIVPAIGLGAFAVGGMTVDEKKQYAKLIIDIVAEQLKENPGSIKVVQFTGGEFEMLGSELKEALKAFPDGIAAIHSNNDPISCQTAANASGLSSVMLGAGDQNKLPGFHVWQRMDEMLAGNEVSMTGNVLLDELYQLRNPLFGVFQSAAINRDIQVR